MTDRQPKCLALAHALHAARQKRYTMINRALLRCFFPSKRESVAMFELKIVVQVENGPVISATVLGKHNHNFCGY